MLMNFILGLVSLAMVGSFSLLYFSKSMQQKPDFISKAVAFITANFEKLSFYGMIYGLVAAFLTPIMVANTTDMLVRLLANILLFIMALPSGFEKITAGQVDKLNPAILKEFKSFISYISGQEKILGIAGGVATLLLFAVIFR